MDCPCSRTLTSGPSCLWQIYSAFPFGYLLVVDNQNVVIFLCATKNCNQTATCGFLFFWCVGAWLHIVFVFAKSLAVGHAIGGYLSCKCLVSLYCPTLTNSYRALVLCFRTRWLYCYCLYLVVSMYIYLYC